LVVGGRESLGSYSVQLHSTVGDASGQFVPPFRRSGLERLVESVAAGLLDTGELRRIGIEIFNSLVNEDVRRRYDEALSAARRDGPVRIVLSLADDELHRQPWELMYDGERFVAAAGHTQLVRRIGLSAPETFSIAPPLRVLVAVSDPVDVHPDLDIQKELAWIASVVDADDVYVEIQPADRHIIQSRLREEAFDVLHFSGHALSREGVACLCFESDSWCADLMSADAFKALMEARSLPIVVLCACETAVGDAADAFTGVAQGLVQAGVPAVVAMRSRISDPGASDLAREFYATLRVEFDVVAAVTEARRALFADRLDWHVPVLYTLHVETATLEKAAHARDVPAEPSFRLDLGLLPNVPFDLEFPVAVQYTKRPEQQALGNALVASTPRVVTVDGPPGSGKTALAAEMARRAARQFRGGVVGLDCETTSSVEAILAKINDILLEPSDCQVDLTGPWADNVVLRALGKHPFLVILDNFETVVERSEEHARKILCFLREVPPPSMALVTSRTRLDIGQRVRVETLDRWPFAVLLARIGARKAIHGFDEQLCGRVELVACGPSRANALLSKEERGLFEQAYTKLGGLPFAAEIFMGLVAQGEDVMDLLADLRPLHRRMTELLEVSYGRLSDGAQELLLLMSIFAKPVKRGAIEAVSGRQDWEASLEELTQASLVTSNRYSLHPLIREYASGRFADSAARREAHERAGTYFVSDDDPDPLAAIDHFYTAEDWNSGVEWTNAVAGTLFSAGLWTDAHDRLTKAVEAARTTGNRSAQAVSLGHLGIACRNLGRLREASEHLTEALAISKELEDLDAEGTYLSSLGAAYIALGDTQGAADCFERALHIARISGDREAEPARLNRLGVAYTESWRTEEAMALLNEALAIYQESNDREGQAAVLGNVGICWFQLGRIHEAIEHYKQSLKIAMEINNPGIGGRALNNLGNARFAMGQVVKAIPCHRLALSMAAQTGDRVGELTRLNSLGNDLFLGDLEGAMGCYDRSLSIAIEIGDARGEARALVNQGLGWVEWRSPEEAESCFQQALRIARKMGFPRTEASVLGSLGSLRLSSGRVQEGVGHWLESLSIAQEIADPALEAQISGSLGAAYLAEGDPVTAVRYLTSAARISRQVRIPGEEIRHLWMLGDAWARSNHGDRALACYLVALQLDSSLAGAFGEMIQHSIDLLREEFGDDDFAELVERVDPNKASIVQEMLESVSPGRAPQRGETS